MVGDLVVAVVLLAATVTVLLPATIRRRRPRPVEPVPRRSRDRIGPDGRIR